MTHDEAVLLLPWYVNGTLSTTERGAVDAHVTGCARCVAEIRFLEQAAASMAVLRAEEPSPSSKRLDGVLAQIRSAKQERMEARARPAPVVALWQGVPRFARLALAAQLLLVLGLGAWIAGLYGDRRAMTAAGGDGTAARIAVAFQAGVSEAVLRRTIQDVRGTIVDGPSALGLYTIRLSMPPDSLAAMDRVLAGLRRDSTVVRAAERAP